MRDHGGNLDEARARWGQGDWIDLSTGINRRPYPVPPLPPEAWTNLPTASARAALMDAARAAGVPIVNVGRFEGDQVTFGGDAARLADLSALYRSAFAAAIGA